MTDSPSSAPAAYRVLARKYRPQSFGALIGQDAMVQTLGNAIKRGRLAHAFLMTGVRGVGKTSTARLIAKALNCIGVDGQGGPTIDPCGVCEPCMAIAEGRHIDVIEMDAASHTGVDDVREIIEAVRYAAVSARYKIYIIDEVHMLSKNAFNALLKTLEEPPAHVKFLFATTEVNKVPVTVLSRCQRFDLRRISAEKLADHFAAIVAQEGVEAEPAALKIIAQAAEGSARDGLSILDQAIAHAEMAGAEASGEARARVTADQVRDMLGLSDRGAVRRLFGLILSGDTAAVLAMLRDQHDLGVEPLSLIRGLMEIVHAVTAAKAGRRSDDPAQSVEEREALADWASELGFAPLHRLWQLLLKGHEDVVSATMPVEAAEMALLRLMHAASLPDPSELARLLQEGGGVVRAPVLSSAPAPSAAPQANAPATFEAMVDLLWKNKQSAIADEVEHRVRPVRYSAEGELLFQPAAPVGEGFVQKLKGALDQITGLRWIVTIGDGDQGETPQPTLSERAEAEAAAAIAAIRDMPVIKAALETFPDAELIGVDETAKWSASA
ncbi:DNA polymerase III subunit gamma/tau [Sphingobium subterraneum]|uniref:DNA polymerase III subunit gamma/tau n=1 Tax=Sphingobium subterraneum TaxID=627688 RepID=A0A841J2G1_9SPHN|nr:DNA polymerase III subunit gamma/tau [Sphingobium subterraneum]MBB6124542.1 DNA polymerase-3 subunit gamma/tau [Sphingobium subterraneum]